ncbi:uncharacterized protein LOC117932047 [Vitis riparia]|uniref:uncharacterized protein LOC117932047 n=1 Tax=Vitis riparia TaxID=96939 RepID=UPI00155AA11E|nr:uncharacterized protein LOC117932047 [Vitis riparia]
MVQPEPVSPFDLFGVFAIEIVEEIQIVLTPELMEDVTVGFISRFDDVYDFAYMDLSIFKYLPVSCDSIYILAPYSPTPQIFDIDDKIAQPDSDKDSFDHDFDSIDERVSDSVSSGRAYHLTALKRFFEKIQKFRLRLNPKKCTFGVTFGKLLGHMVSERGIEVDLDKIKAILDMLVPRTEKEIKGFLGRLQYIRRFIARLTDICEPIFRFLRKNQPTVWYDNCQLAFEKIKEYLLSPPVLVPPMSGRPLLLYLLVSDMALGFMLALLDDSGKKRAIYYLNKRMLEYEMRYVMIECLYLALVWATNRLRHYMTEYSVHLISRLDSLRYLFDRPALTSRLMKWLVFFTEFDIQYVSQKSIKESIVIDHLASLLISKGGPVDDDFPNEKFLAMTSLSGWRMYFDGTANHSGFRIGILLISPYGDHIPRSIRLAFSDRHPTMNNIVEYEACILGLETASELGIRQMEIFSDSNLFADVLAALASCVDFPTDVVIRSLLIDSRFAPTYCCLIGETEVQDDLPWYHDIYQLLRFGTYPEATTANDWRALRQLATRFVICGETLHKRSADAFTAPLVCDLYAEDL